jgi:hypothetical protein
MVRAVREVLSSQIFSSSMLVLLPLGNGVEDVVLLAGGLGPVLANDGGGRLGLQLVGGQKAGCREVVRGRTACGLYYQALKKSQFFIKVQRKCSKQLFICVDTRHIFLY